MNHSLTAIIKDKRGNVLAIGKNCCHEADDSEYEDYEYEEV